jgi:hypothetical protein
MLYIRQPNVQNLSAVQDVFNRTFWWYILIFLSYLLLVCYVSSFRNVFYPELCMYLLFCPFMLHILSLYIKICVPVMISSLVSPETQLWGTIQFFWNVMLCHWVSGSYIGRVMVSWGWRHLDPESPATLYGNLKFKIVRNILFCRINLKCHTSDQSPYVKRLYYHLYSNECSYDDTLNSEGRNGLDHLQDEWIKNTKETLRRKNIWLSSSREARGLAGRRGDQRC